MHTTYLNGVILVSPTGLGIKRDGPVSAALSLPYYSATAWYHKQLETELQGKSLEDLLQEVETFSIDKFLPGIALGNSISDKKKKRISNYGW